MRSLSTMIALTVFFLGGLGPSPAATPNGTLRVFLARAEPTSEFSGVVVGQAVIVEADSATGLGMGYENRMNQRVGLEFGFSFIPFDFDETVVSIGATGELGDAMALPFWFGVDVHVLGEDTKVDLYVGPVVAFTVWSPLSFSNLAGGGESDLDNSFGLGAVLGLDVPFSSQGWQFNAALRYLTMSAEDPSLEIEVDPWIAEVGLGYRF